ncbi:MAG TPA: helix-turn-helix domain-containing protein [Bryobacteraceae bacterium]|nr:helix-turn-helix domain-containing protein [Bryobacteraceae bacterium]
MAYSDDLRQKVLRAVDTHQASQARLAEIFGVSLSWVKGIVRRRRETGNPHALPHRGGRRPKLSAAQCDALQQYLAAHDDFLLRELQQWLQRRYHLALSLSSLSRLLSARNWPRKKNRCTPPNAIL